MLGQYYHLPFFRVLRSLGRKSGILTIVKKWKSSITDEYEEKFASALKGAVRSGDTVWDVGANVGLYTRQFLDRSAPHGKVVAFEPLTQAHTVLTRRIAEHQYGQNAVVLKLALADREGEVFLEASDWDAPADGVPTTIHIRDSQSTQDANTGEATEVSTADSVVLKRRCPPPVVTKIDVEGYEEEVLNGGESVFKSMLSREILIEIHFTRLEQRGQADAPARMVKKLSDWGYSYKWLDSSHLHAYRP